MGRRPLEVTADAENVKAKPRPAPKQDTPRKWTATIHGKPIEIPKAMTAKQAAEFINKARIKAKDPKAAINEVNN
jgi:hypothetical protein